MHQAQQDLLVLEAQSGNEKAFECLVAFYHPQLIKFATSLSGNHDLGKDAVQDVWINMTKKLRTLNDPRAFKSWIFRAVRWRVTDLAKSKFNQFEAFDESSMESTLNEVSQLDETSIEQQQIRQLIQQLPEKERTIVILFYMAELSISEIALVQEIPVGTVKSQLNRARKALAKRIEKQSS